MVCARKSDDCLSLSPLLLQAVARGLNNTQIGGKKRDFYREDIWNLKYLRGFKWDHLTEKVNMQGVLPSVRICG